MCSAKMRQHQAKLIAENWTFDHDKFNVQSNTKEAEDGKSVCCSHNPSVAKSNLGSRDSQKSSWQKDQEVACVDCNPMHHEHPTNNDEHVMVYIHTKGANLTTPCPHSQAKELFPAVLAWHAMRTSGGESASSNLRLAWTVDLWDRMTASFNPTPPDLNDLSMSSKLCNQVSNKKIKSSHATAELTVET
jgi:hypothetical protein